MSDGKLKPKSWGPWVQGHKERAAARRFRRKWAEKQLEHTLARQSIDEEVERQMRAIRAHHRVGVLNWFFGI